MSSVSTPMIKKVFRLSLPMAGSRFLQMFTGFIATMMVAHFGKTVLAACALINATVTVLLLIFISVVFSLSFIVGQAFGAKDYKQIGALVHQGSILSLILSIPMMICCWYAADILSLFHQNSTQLVYVQDYFHALTWGIIPIMLQSCLEQFCYGILKQRLVIIVNVLSVIVGVSIAYLLILGHGGFRALAVTGLGLTFSIQSWFDLIVLTGCCYFMRDFKPYELFQKKPLQKFILLKKIFRIGWPMSVQFGGELGAFFVITMMIGWLGTNALAAVQVTQQWMYLIIVPVFAMSEASGILVGQAVGAKEYFQLNLINRSSLYLSLGLVAIADIGFIFFPHFFAAFYLQGNDAKNPAILALIQPLFMLTAITLIFNSARDVISGSLRGLFDTQFPMRVGILVMWGLVLPLGYLFAFTFHMNVIGFRLGGNIGLCIGALVLYWRWKKKAAHYSCSAEKDCASAAS